MPTRSQPGSRSRKRAKTILSEMVTRRARDAAALLASIRVHKARVATTLSERFTPALRAGEAIPDHELTLELAGRCVQRAYDHLEELDDLHCLAKADRAHFARELDRVAKQELYPEAVGVRRQIDAAFGRQAGSELHTFTGKTPRTASRLLKHVERAVSRLGNPNRVLPLASVAGEPNDRAAWRLRLQTPWRKLTEIDDDLAQRTSLLNTLGGRRQRAMQHFDAVYADTFRLVEAAFLMAGIDPKMIKSLRSGIERRHLARRARKKRETRANGQATAGGAALPAESTPAEPTHRSSPGAFATVSRWLKRRWILG